MEQAPLWLHPTAAQPGDDAELVDVGLALKQAVDDNDLDRAQRLIDWFIDQGHRPADDPHLLFFRVMVMIKRGRSVDALQMLAALGEDHCPELVVLCRCEMKDPYWIGAAQELLSSPRASSLHPEVRDSIATLLTSVNA